MNSRIEKACADSGRKRSEITLLPVTKTRAPHELEILKGLGFSRFGENKVQEIVSKANEPSLAGINWCAIGYLQSNKVKDVCQHASEIHSLDRLKIARALELELQKLGKSMRVLIQVNTSNEAQKYGLHIDEVLDFAREIEAYECLKVEGLMTLALFSDDEKLVRPCFQKLKKLQEKLQQDLSRVHSWSKLSMGMSGDFEMAIAEGATEIRLGQALFGPRNTSDSFYWPGLGG